MLGGNSSVLPGAATMCTAQPRRRSSPASTISWLMIAPPNGAAPGSAASPQLSAKARVRIMALWPQKVASLPDHQIMPAVATGP